MSIKEMQMPIKYKVQYYEAPSEELNLERLK